MWYLTCARFIKTRERESQSHEDHNPNSITSKVSTQSHSHSPQSQLHVKRKPQPPIISLPLRSDISTVAPSANRSIAAATLPEMSLRRRPIRIPRINMLGIGNIMSMASSREARK